MFCPPAWRPSRVAKHTRPEDPPLPICARSRAQAFGSHDVNKIGTDMLSRVHIEKGAGTLQALQAPHTALVPFATKQPRKRNALLPSGLLFRDPPRGVHRAHSALPRAPFSFFLSRLLPTAPVRQSRKKCLDASRSLTQPPPYPQRPSRWPYVRPAQVSWTVLCSASSWGTA